MSLYEDFLSRINRKFAEDSEQMPMSAYIEANTHLRKKPFSFDGYEFQRKIVDDLHLDLSVIKCSQVGLALALDTPVPTPSGWATMGELQVGDQVFDEQGRPCHVEYVSPVYKDHKCFGITFDDGNYIVADANHRWFVESDRPFNETEFHTGRGRPRRDMKRSGILKTERIAEAYTRHHGRHVFAIPNTAPLQTDDQPLPIDPYFLGLWLGDGNLHASVITTHISDAENLQDNLKERGLFTRTSSVRNDVIQLWVGKKGQVKGVSTLSYRLKTLGLLGQRKFIPTQYLRASEHNRRELLRGLLDSDGSVTKRGRVSFHNTCQALVEGVEDLVCSLGYKSRTRWRTPVKTSNKIQGKSPIAEVSFVAYADEQIFGLKRKQIRIGTASKGRPTEALRRRIVHVEEAPTVPVRCISVNSPSHLFLAGKGMIPTHNTEVQIRKFLAFLKRTNSINGIFSLPNDEMYKRVSKTRIRPIVDEEEVFNQHEPSKKPVRSMDLYQIDDSFGFITGGKEGDATSINADIMFNDEVDLTDQEILALYGSRLQGSDIKMRQGFSTPTFESYGIDSAYKASDQHEYLCRCTKCNHWNMPVFTPNFIRIPGLPADLNDLSEIDPDIAAGLDLENAFVMCEHCGAPLDLGNPELREWVPRHPSRKSRGYWVRPFATPRLTVDYIVRQLLDYKRKNSMRRWYNTVLGEPYNDANARLSIPEIEAVMKGEGKPDVSSEVPVAIGVDVGQTCHVVLASLGLPIPYVFDWLQVPSDELRDTIANLRERYNIVAGGMDLNPYAPLAREIRDASNSIIMPIEYATSPSAAPITLVKDELDNVTHVRSNRTGIIDAVVGDIRNQKILFMGYGTKKSIIMTHLQDMVRVELPEQPAKWVKLTGDDHFFHALGYLKHALRIHQFINHQDEQEERQMAMILGLIQTVQQNEADLGVHGRMKSPSVLGLSF